MVWQLKAGRRAGWLGNGGAAGVDPLPPQERPLKDDGEQRLGWLLGAYGEVPLQRHC